MAYFYGLILFTITSIVFADYPAYGWYAYSTSNNKSTACFASALAACNGIYSVPDGSYSAITPGASNTCYLTRISDGASLSSGIYRYEPCNSCPTGGTLSGTTCVQAACPTGQTHNVTTGICSIDCNSLKGKSVTDLRSSSNSLNFYDSTGCQISLVSGNTCSFADGSSCFRIEKGVYTGITSVSTDKPSASESSQNASKTCPLGTCPGTFNGSQICLACSSTGGTSVSAGSKTVTNSDGSKVSSTTTYNQTGDTITTTTATTNTTSAGVSTTSPPVTSQQDQTSFCEQNPGLSICKDSSFGSIDCGTQPTCSGDAVQCATATQIWKTRCERSAFNDQYDSATSASGKASDAAALALVTTDLSGGISMARHLTESCISDVSVTVMGHSVSLPVSNVCPYLGWMGNMMIAMSMLVAVRIVGGATY